MIALELQEIREATGGQVLAGASGAMVVSICTDSRKLEKGDLFIPLKGANFDGHDFIDAVMSRGAGGFITERVDRTVSRWTDDRHSLVLKVDDTGSAFADIAQLVRDKSLARVVGITGSTGKTSTKDMLAAIAGQSFKTVSSIANHNNEVGVPLTLTKAQQETEIMIVEMAMRGAGQISDLARVARPDIGVVTNVGLTHAELVGSEERIARAKGELIEALPVSGHAVLNHDDKWTELLRTQTKARVLTFGLDPAADFSMADATYDEEARATWRLIKRGRPGPMITLGVPGRHNISNALAAVAVASILGIPEHDVIAALQTVKLSGMRLSFIKSPAGFSVINDAYNANPASMASALETLDRIETRGRRAAVLGEMAELGPYSEQAHEELGKLAAESGLSLLVTVGERARSIYAAAIENGFPAPAAAEFGSAAEAADWIGSRLEPGDTVLIKGSRVARLEDVAERLSRER